MLSGQRAILIFVGPQIRCPAFLYFQSCPQTVSSASVCMTAANSGAHPSKRGDCQAATPSHPNFKKHIFCRRDDIRRFTRFTLHPKPATEIG